MNKNKKQTKKSAPKHDPKRASKFAATRCKVEKTKRADGTTQTTVIVTG